MKIQLLFIAGLVVTSLWSEEPTSVCDIPEYRTLCQEAFSNENLYRNFKRNNSYRSVLEHVTKQEGKKYLSAIQKNAPHLLSHWPQFSTNDKVGNPITYFFEGIGQASPTTLRYVKVLGDLEFYFGDLTDKNILEIGGGYGGQCKIIHDYFKFKNYAIVDLPEPLQLTKKVLEQQNISPVEMISNGQWDKPIDLLISNFAFSQCNRYVQEKYVEDYLLKAKNGYLTMNNVHSMIYPSPFSPLEIREMLLDKGYNVRIFPEDPQTHPQNILLIWSS